MDRTDQAAKDKVMELIKDIPIAMLSTRGPDRKFHSRPMATSDTAFDGKLYFLTDIGSGKTHDLEGDAETLVTYSDHSANRYVALRGQGTISQDRAAISDHWTAAARAWFPKGKDDPSVALITVEIEDAEYWDAPSGRMVMLYAYAKALATGQKPGNIGDHDRVSMR